MAADDASAWPVGGRRAPRGSRWRVRSSNLGVDRGRSRSPEGVRESERVRGRTSERSRTRLVLIGRKKWRGGGSVGQRRKGAGCCDSWLVSPPPSPARASQANPPQACQCVASPVWVRRRRPGWPEPVQSLPVRGLADEPVKGVETERTTRARFFFFFSSPQRRSFFHEPRVRDSKWEKRIRSGYKILRH